MRKLLLLLIVIAIIPLCVFIIKSVSLQRSTDISVTAVPSEIFPSLYPKIYWNKPNTGDITLSTSEQMMPNSSDIQKLGQDTKNFSYIISKPVEQKDTIQVVNYYESWFKMNSWKEDIIGNSPLGDIYGFLKGGKRFLVDIHALPNQGYEIEIEHN